MDSRSIFLSCIFFKVEFESTIGFVENIIVCKNVWEKFKYFRFIFLNLMFLYKIVPNCLYKKNKKKQLRPDRPTCNWTVKLFWDLYWLNIVLGLKKIASYNRNYRKNNTPFCRSIRISKTIKGAKLLHRPI